ncbi:uncharacterized protein [Clytia hemisphaerica]|uniref:uncharacterized protein n=1 Tax=Clytia hemisphaerica TaxID=252671 RepID=UPI0034D6C742
MNPIQQIQEIFGTIQPIVLSAKGPLYRCVEAYCRFFGHNLSRHLIESHKWEKGSAKLESSCRVTLFRYLHTKSKYSKQPQVCKPCGICVRDIDKHIKRYHGKFGADHLIFKAMNCDIAKVTPLQNYVKGNLICPPAQNSINECLNDYKNDKAPTYKKPSFAINCRDIKESDIRQHKLKTLTDFKHIYDNYRAFSEDFNDWLQHVLNHSPRASKQIVTNLQEIWLSVDPTLTLYPNKLSDTNALEDSFFLPHFTKLKDHNLQMNRSKSQLKPTTLCSKLSSLRKLIEFSTSRQLFLGLTYPDMQRIRSKTQEFNRRLHPYCKERQSAMQDFKLEKLIDCKKLIITLIDCKI